MDFSTLNSPIPKREPHRTHRHPGPSPGPGPDPTPSESALAVVVATAVGALIGFAVEAGAAWTDQRTPNGGEFEALGRGLMSLALGIPLTILVTGLLFWRLPLRNRLAAGVFALFVGFSLWQALFDFGITTHSSHFGWPALPLAFGFGLATWVFLPGRSIFVGIAAIVGVLVVLTVAPHIKADRYNAQTERQIAAAGVPIATTTVSGYQLASAYGSSRYDPVDPSKLDLVFTRPSTRIPPGDYSFRVRTYVRPPAFDPPTSCAWAPDRGDGDLSKKVHCTEVASGVWLDPKSDTVVTEYHGAVVTVTNFGQRKLPRSKLIEAARHLHPTTAHDLTHTAATSRPR